MADRGYDENTFQMHKYKVTRKPVSELVAYQQISSEEQLSVTDDAKIPRLGPLKAPTTYLSAIHVWWPEILASIASAAAFTGIVVTLILVNGKPLPKLPFQASINTLIAVFATTLKVTAVFVLAQGLGQSKWSWYGTSPNRLHDFLIYDNASRGPWGSIQFIWYLHGRAPRASLGAMITIAALFVDPLSQQLIRFYDCSEVVDGQTAQLPRTQYYNELGGHIGAGMIGIAPDFMGSLASGQFSQIPPQVPFVCETGNCTFQSVYSSMGYCSACFDVSNQLRLNYNDTDSTTIVTLGDPDDYSSLSFEARDSMSSGVRFAMSGSGSGIDMAWYDGLVSNVTNSYNGTTTDRTPQGHAYHCVLEPCVHEFSAEIMNGKLSEKTLNRFNVTFGRLSDLVASVVDLQCLHGTALDDLKDLGYEVGPSMRWLPYNVTINPRMLEADIGRYTTSRSYNVSQAVPGVRKNFYIGDNSNWMLSESGLRIVPPECIYQNDALLANSMDSLWFADYFTGNVTDTTYSSDVLGSIVPRFTYFAGREHGATGQGLEGIQSMTQNITDSMTTYMRSHGNVNLSAVTVGEVHRYAVCVTVRWGYLAHSGSIVLLLLLFLPATIVGTRRSERDSGQQINAGSSLHHDFKSSALASLYHGFQVHGSDHAGGTGALNRVRELEVESRYRVVHLAMTPKGYKLVDVGVR